MGSYDGIQICELIGIFVLSIIWQKYNSKDIGLYRDDGLSVLNNTSGLELEKVKKYMQKIFKGKKLDIIVERNIKNS